MEIWKPLKDYEGIYEMSNKGRIKSLKRKIIYRDGRVRHIDEKILKPVISNRGYYHVGLNKNGKEKKKDVHQLVAIAFLNHTPCKNRMFVVNHIDMNKLNNNLENLEIVTFRENTNQKHLKSHSKYTGVIKGSSPGKFRACICIKDKSYHLGTFKDELKAKAKYDKALLDYEIYGKLPEKHKFSSKHKGVYFHKPTGKWQANHGSKYIGIFETEQEAYLARQNH